MPKACVTKKMKGGMSATYKNEGKTNKENYEKKKRW